MLKVSTFSTNGKAEQLSRCFTTTTKFTGHVGFTACASIGLKFNNPFEQFTIYAQEVGACPIPEYTLPAAGFTFIFVLAFISATYTYGSVFINSGANGLLRRAFGVVKSIIRDNLAAKRQQFTPVILFLFLFVLVSNMVGMLPYATTLTSSFVFTLFLAIQHYIGANILGVARSGWGFVTIFLPQGLPLSISQLLVFIEAVSYIARGVSLSIRLFANMFAGHVLLKLMSSKGASLLAGGSVICLPIIFGIIPITVLELLVAFLQAYVFTLLVTLYINDPLSNNTRPTSRDLSYFH